MGDSITICIGTVGSPTFARCKKIIDELAAESPNVVEVVVIKNKSPQSAWLNTMRNACVSTKWCLQIDEDMYLKKNAITELLKFAKKKEADGVKILNASSLLYDLFLEKKIGSLKLWNSEALQQLEFRDVLGGDRDFAKRAAKLGYQNVEISKVLGDHDSAPTAAIAFSKYYEYTQKMRKFGSDAGARHFVGYLKRKWKMDGSYISKKAYNGASKGLSSSLRNKSKRKLPPPRSEFRPLIATPIWRREDVFRLFVKNNSQFADILAVGSEGRRSELLSKSLGCHYVEEKNKPLGRKFNARIKWFIKSKQYTHIILLGSDDLISKEVFSELKTKAMSYDLISWGDLYFYDMKSKTGAYTFGYKGGRSTEPLAPGRCLSRSLVERIGPNLWPDDANSSPDGKLWSKKLKSIKSQTVLSMKDINGIIVDIKTEGNRTTLKQILKTSNNRELTDDERSRILEMIK
jgi:hypothetical protein